MKAAAAAEQQVQSHELRAGVVDVVSKCAGRLGEKLQIVRPRQGGTMMKPHGWIFACTVGIAALGAAPLRAQPAAAIVGDELRALVSGKSWALSTYGDPTNPNTTMVWDFRSDGTVCARPGASNAGDKCADEGKWVLRGDLLCWDLTWFGASFGFKTACCSVKRTGPDRLQLHSEKAPDLTYMVARPL